MQNPAQDPERASVQAQFNFTRELLYCLKETRKIYAQHDGRKVNPIHKQKEILSLWYKGVDEEKHAIFAQQEFAKLMSAIREQIAMHQKAHNFLNSRLDIMRAHIENIAKQKGKNASYLRLRQYRINLAKIPYDQYVKLQGPEDKKHVCKNSQIANQVEQLGEIELAKRLRSEPTGHWTKKDGSAGLGLVLKMIDEHLLEMRKEVDPSFLGPIRKSYSRLVKSLGETKEWIAFLQIQVKIYEGITHDNFLESMSALKRQVHLEIEKTYDTAKQANKQMLGVQKKMSASRKDLLKVNTLEAGYDAYYWYKEHQEAVFIAVDGILLVLTLTGALAPFVLGARVVHRSQLLSGVFSFFKRSRGARHLGHTLHQTLELTSTFNESEEYLERGYHKAKEVLA